MPSVRDSEGPHCLRLCFPAQGPAAQDSALTAPLQPTQAGEKGQCLPALGMSAATGSLVSGGGSGFQMPSLTVLTLVFSALVWCLMQFTD